jgi:hypothetical protein
MTTGPKRAAVPKCETSPTNGTGRLTRCQTRTNMRVVISPSDIEDRGARERVVELLRRLLFEHEK